MATDATSKVIECTQLGVQTQTGLATPKLDIELQAGEALAIVGRPGSGKSLVFEAISGILRPGVAIVGSLRVVRPALVPQDSRLAVLPSDRVWSLLGLSGFAVRLQQETGVQIRPSAAEQLTDELMGTLRLDRQRISALPFGALSATEKRLVLLCAALQQNPAVLLIDGWDEMTDGPTRLAVARILAQRRAEGMALLVSSRRHPLRNLPDLEIRALGEMPGAGGELALPLIRKAPPPVPHTHSLLDVHRLRVSFKRRSLLQSLPPATPVDGAHLFVRHGETLALLGMGGSGKSTLFRAICGLISSSDGTIRVSGHNVTHAQGSRARRLRRDVQLVFQAAFTALDSRRTVRSHLEEAFALSPGSPGTPAERLERLGLSPRLLDAPAQQLGAGESQCVDLARSLVVSPRLVLFDAPEVAGANTDGGLIAAALAEEKARGVSFLVATSDPDIARSLGDRVAIFYAGRVVELGTVLEVFESPAHPVTRSLLDDADLRPTSPLERHLGCPYVSECSRRKLPQCTETEPMLAPLRTHNEQVGGGVRRVACFYPHPVE